MKMLINSKNMSEKADDGYSLLSYFKVFPGYADNRRLKVTWDWSSMEIAQNLLQQAKILYYNDLDVDLFGQEIIQNYQIKEFDLTNLHPDTKYLICFRVTRKRFVDSSMLSSTNQSNNDTAMISTSTIKSSLHQWNKTLIMSNDLQHILHKQKTSSPINTYPHVAFLNQTHTLQSSVNSAKLFNEYVAEMQCQITLTRFLHWTAILCSLIGIIVALLLSITIICILKSRTYQIKQRQLKMCFNRKTQLSLVGHGKFNEIHTDDDVDENNLTNSTKLVDACHHPLQQHHQQRHHHHHLHHHHHHLHHHPHSHHQHQHHHHHYHAHHPHPHHHHHHHHFSLQNVLNTHIRYDCHSKRTTIRKSESGKDQINRSMSSSPSTTITKTPTIYCKPSLDKLEIIKDANVKVNKPSDIKENNELMCPSNPQLINEWENTLKIIETNQTIINNDTSLNQTQKSSNTNQTTTNIINDIHESRVMENETSVSYKDINTTTNTTTTTTNDSTTNNNSVTYHYNNSIDNSNNNNNNNNSNICIKVHQGNNNNNNDNSNQLSDSQNDDNFNKPIGITMTESGLMHCRHHIAENAQSDVYNNNNNNNRLLENNPICYCEIKSPSLKDVQPKSCDDTLNNQLCDSHTMNHNRLIQIPNTNNDESLQNPLSSSTTIRTMTTVEKNISTNSIPNNDTLLIDHSTSNIDGKHFIPKDYNRFMTSSNLSTNNVINTSEQKSIFHTQLIETL